jgi:hypothetical protein
LGDQLSPKTIKETLETKVIDEADVVVVGGGPGGHSAAIAAARNGAKVILLERYGHLGGMATGGIVIQIPHMSDGGKDPVIAGLTMEWLQRLDKIPGGTLRPRNEDIGSDDPALVKKWSRFMGNVINGHIEHTAWVDPELTKCMLNDMVEEAGIKLYLHSWSTKAIAENGKVKGVIFESKSGRQAIMGKIIIDGTGDGDLFPSAGADYDGRWDETSRSSMMALVFRIGNCDFQKYCDFKEANPEKSKQLMEELKQVAGTLLLPIPSPRNDIMWINNWVRYDCTKVEDLTKMELFMRKLMPKAHAFMKKNIPSFENSFIIDSAPQIGTRGGKRLTGEYKLTKEDFDNCTKFDDTIAVFPRLGPPGDRLIKRVYIPYRVVVPAKVDGLLAAGRSFSSDMYANNAGNLIPHCIVIGQAAGTAAAMAIKQNISPRKVNIKELQKTLVKQGAALPGII